MRQFPIRHRASWIKGPNLIRLLHDSLRSSLAWFRYLTERLLVVPAADYLPLWAALAVADAAGYIDAVIPIAASRVARREIAASTDLRGWPQFRAASARLATPRRDLVYLRRMARGRERLGDWTLAESNPDGVQRLLAERRSFLLATAHFPYSANNIRNKRIPRDSSIVLGAIPAWKLSPYELRRRLEMQLLFQAQEKFLALRSPQVVQVPDLWLTGQDWAKLPHHADSVQDTILAKLAEPGTVVIIFADAYWEKPNVYRRPFAGMNERGFASGVARIARLAQCPIVPFVAVHGSERHSTRIEWGNPIDPPESEDQAADRRTLDAVLDWLERTIGHYPIQYSHALGYDRRWDAETERWLT